MMALKIPLRRGPPALPRFLHTAADILAILDTADPAEAALDRALPRLSSAVAAAVVERHRDRDRDRAVGFRFFVWASQWRKLRSGLCAGLVMGMLGDEAGFELYWAALERAREAGLSIDSYPFWVLIKGLGKAGMDEKAVESFGKMKEEFECVPDVGTYNSILCVLLQRQVFLLALAVYNDMLKLNVSPDVTTYNILVSGFCKSLRIKDALQMLDEMSERGLVPDTVTNNIILNGLCRAEKVDQARRLFISIREKGSSHPDAFTYNSMLNGYCKLGRIDEAYAFLKSSRNDGFVMGLEGYSCLIDSLFKARRFVEAHGWYRKMIESGIVPDVVLYSIMIRGLAGEGRIEEALDLVNRMSESGVAPNAYCYSAIVKGLCDAGLVDEARALHLEVSDREFLPNTYTYTVLLCAMCKKGLVKEAEEIFEEMDRVGCSPSVVTFNALINGLCKAKELEKVHMLFYKMEIGKNPSIFLRLSQGSNGAIDGSSLKNMVDQLCGSGQILKAYRLMMQLNNTGVSPDTWTYNTLIDGFCKAGSVNSALKLFKDMRFKGLSPDSVTYGTLIEGLQRADREEDSFKVYNQMIQNGFTPKSDVYKPLMVWSCRRGKFSLAFNLWLRYQESLPERDKEAIAAVEEDFKKRRLEKAIRGLLKMDLGSKDFDPSPYTIFLIGLCDVGRLDDALMVFTVLEEHKVVVSPPSCVRLIYDLCAKGGLDLAIKVFVYALEKRFLVRRACNHLIKCLLFDRSKKNVTLELIRKIESSEHGVDTYLYPTTKLLLSYRLKPS